MPVSVEFPAFRPRPPWWGGDLQTIRGFLLQGLGLTPPALSGEPVALPARDGSGDRMMGILNRSGAGDAPLVVLLHGLLGDAEAVYMTASARYLTGQGYPVLRLNLRGAGLSAKSCNCRFHAARGDDIADALSAVDGALLRQGVLFAGFSIGGNTLLKFLAEHGQSFPVLAAATVSAPLNLAATVARLMEPRNWIYQKILLAETRKNWAGADLTPARRQALAEARTIYELDNRVVAPCGGFRGADDYYAECMALDFLDAISVPTLIIHAANDPWTPISAHRGRDWSRNAALTPLLPDSGGHVGFHGRGSAIAWHDRCMGEFFGALAG